MTKSRKGLSAAGSLVSAVVLLIALVAGVGAPAQAHSTTEYVRLWSPIVGASKWATTPGTEPATHHIVYSNWGYMNDWPVDVFAPAGSRIVSPFGSKASNGQATRVRVVGLRVGCASGSAADGGYRMTLELSNAGTGVVLARADLMHVDRPQVGIGATVGPWTTLGYTSAFRYSSCYQVRTSAGVHVHLEIINKHRYSCYIRRANGTAMTENTEIGRAAVHYTARRAAC